jgi:hypothetical protein
MWKVISCDILLHLHYSTIFVGWIKVKSESWISSRKYSRSINPGGSQLHSPSLQWEFQDPKMEVLYHIRPYFVVIFPLIIWWNPHFLRVKPPVNHWCHWLAPRAPNQVTIGGRWPEASSRWRRCEAWVAQWRSTHFAIQYDPRKRTKTQQKTQFIYHCLTHASIQSI